VAQIEFKNITKTFDNGKTIIEDLNLRIDNGSFTVLVGPSGCGKTTVLRMISGLEKVTGGRIFIGGEDMTDRAPGDRGIAMVFQNYAIYPHMSVRQNVEFGLENLKIAKSGLWAECVDEYL
jgi:sn-glycerol 3-phosphate transport system ATP-binding protein